MPKIDPRRAGAAAAAPASPPPAPSARTFDAEVAELAGLGFTDIEFEQVGPALRLSAMYAGAPQVAVMDDSDAAPAALVATLKAAAGL